MSDSNNIAYCHACGAGNITDAMNCRRCGVTYHTAPPDPRCLEIHLDYLNTLRKPAVALRKTAEPQFSKLGGLPSMPADLAWPVCQDRPLSFLCQIDLARFPRADFEYPLPAAGVLYVFFDQMLYLESCLSSPEDRQTWRVLYSPTGPDACVTRSAPGEVYEKFHEQFVTFTRIDTYPYYFDDRVMALELTDAQFEMYNDLCDAVYAKGQKHAFFGHPALVQPGDITAWCQFGLHGLEYNCNMKYITEKERSLLPGAADWILLLQLDYDDDTGMFWGTNDKLYFCIRKDDLAAQHFENCWVVMWN